MHRRSFRGCCCRSMASSAMAERLPLRKYTTEDGLAHARVRRIVRDPRGFLWFCTVDGLSRFDGAEFVTYRTGDGLPDPWVTDVLATRDGTYWVATNAGVAMFDPFARAAGNDRPTLDRRSTATVLHPRGLRRLACTSPGSRPAGGSRWPHLGGWAGWTVHPGQERFRHSRSGPSFRGRRRWSPHWWRVPTVGCGWGPWTASFIDGRQAP